MRRIEPWRAGNLFSVASPAIWPGVHEIDAAATLRETRGFRVRVSHQSYSRRGQFAGTDVERAQAINAASANHECAAILCAKSWIQRVTQVVTPLRHNSRVGRFSNRAASASSYAWSANRIASAASALKTPANTCDLANLHSAKAGLLVVRHLVRSDENLAGRLHHVRL
jgi:hypothetical protein